MADLVEGAGATAEQVARELGRGSATVAKGTTRLSVRVAGGMFKGVGAVYGVARKTVRARATTGAVRLRVFTRVAGGKREIVPVKDAEVARLFVRELRRHGVLFSVERHRDGTRTFHVQGQDASVIEHALSRAMTRVDESLARRRGPVDVDDVAPGERVLNLTDEQSKTLAETLRSAPDARTADVDRPTVEPLPAAAALADQVERDGAVVLTDTNVDAIESALGAPGAETAQLADVAEAVAEEKAAIAAGAGDATRDLTLPENAPDVPGEPVPVALPVAEDLDSTVTMVLGERESATLAEGLRGAAAPESVVAPERLTELAESVEQESRIVLTPANIEALDQTFTVHGWTPDADPDHTPEHMRWIVEAVAEERDRIQQLAPAEDVAIAAVPADVDMAQEPTAPEQSIVEVEQNPFLTEAVAAPPVLELDEQPERPVVLNAEQFEEALGPFNPDDLPEPGPDPFDPGQGAGEGLQELPTQPHLLEERMLAAGRTIPLEDWGHVSGFGDPTEYPGWQWTTDGEGGVEQLPAAEQEWRRAMTDPDVSDETLAQLERAAGAEQVRIALDRSELENRGYDEPAPEALGEPAVSPEAEISEWQREMADVARTGHQQGVGDRDYFDTVRQRGHTAAIRQGEQQDLNRIHGITDRAIRADDLRTLPRDDVYEIHRLAARWNNTSPTIARAIAGFDETVARPDRAVNLPTTQQVAADPERARSAAVAATPNPYLEAAPAEARPEGSWLTQNEAHQLQLEERMLNPLPEPSPEVVTAMSEMIQGHREPELDRLIGDMEVPMDEHMRRDPSSILVAIRAAAELQVDPNAPSTQAAMDVLEAMKKPGLYEGTLHEASTRRLASTLQTVTDPARTSEAVQLGLSRRESTRERLAQRIETKAAELKATYAAQALQRTPRSRGASKGK